MRRGRDPPWQPKVLLLQFRSMAEQKQFKNRQAYHQFHILEKIEAGIVLVGSEVKSIRDGKINFADSYARIEQGEIYLVGCHISEYKNAKNFGHEPTRRRKLLLRRQEIRKLLKKVEVKGLTLVPLRLYFNKRGFAKLEIGIGRGKQLHDKRKSLKERDVQRDVQREMSRYSG